MDQTIDIPKESLKILIVNEQMDEVELIRELYKSPLLDFSNSSLSNYNLDDLLNILHEDRRIGTLVVKAFDQYGRPSGLELLGRLKTSTYWKDYRFALQVVLQIDPKISLRRWKRLIPFICGGISPDITKVRENLQVLERIVQARPDSSYIYIYSKLNEDLIFSEESIIKHETLVDLEIFTSVDGPIMITGETGTEKESVARYLHLLTWHQVLGNRVFEDRKLKSAVESLFISYDLSGARDQGELAYYDLFGQEHESSSGSTGKKGLFFLANEISDHLSYPSQVTDLPEEYISSIRPLTDYLGMIPRVPFLVTLFLYEVGDMPARLQTVLHRILLDKKLERFGLEWESGQFLRRVRVITATTQKLMLSNWRTMQDFSQELYHLMLKVSLNVPSLKERRSDFMLLFCSILRRMWEKYDDIFWFDWDQKTLKTFLEYDWPGNAKELEEIIGLSYLYTKKLNRRRELKGEMPCSLLQFPKNIMERLREPKQEGSPFPLIAPESAARKSDTVVARASAPSQTSVLSPAPPAHIVPHSLPTFSFSGKRRAPSVHSENSIYHLTDDFMDELRELEVATGKGGLPEEEVKQMVKNLITGYCTEIDCRYHHEIVQRFGVIALARICRILYRIRNYWPTDSVYEKEIFKAGESSIKSLLTRSGISFKQLENPRFRVHVRNLQK